MTNHDLQKAVDGAITSRHSIRGFLRKDVAREDIEQILHVAACAPSGTNTQPWKVKVLTGATKLRLTAEIMTAYSDPVLLAQCIEEYHYYPRQWTSPYIERRRKVGWDLYSLLGLTRENKAGIEAQQTKNYDFFGAPVGLIFSIDRMMEQGSWLDYGMFLQNIMIAARGRGLDTCPQAAFTQFHRIISAQLQIPNSEMIVCGMALGYADMAMVENSLHTEREAVSQFAQFLD